MMDLAPASFADRDLFRERFGDPTEWSGDWRRDGRYLGKEEHLEVQRKLRRHRRLIVALELRRIPCATVAAIFGVSRETIARRLRPLGLKNPPGTPGRPKRTIPSMGGHTRIEAC